MTPESLSLSSSSPVLEFGNFFPWWRGRLIDHCLNGRFVGIARFRASCTTSSSCYGLTDGVNWARDEPPSLWEWVMDQPPLAFLLFHSLAVGETRYIERKGGWGNLHHLVVWLRHGTTRECYLHFARSQAGCPVSSLENLISSPQIDCLIFV